MIMKFKCFYNIARVLALYVPLSRNEKNLYLPTGVNIFLPSYKVAILFSCIAVSLLIKIWKKPANNCRIFLSALTFYVIQQAAQMKKKKIHKLWVSQICTKVGFGKFWPQEFHWEQKKSPIGH